jgi:hypothetical protein
VEEGMMKGKQVDHLICDRIIGCCLLQFPCKSEIETVVMTEEMGMAEMTEVMWIILIFLILVMQ